MSEVIATNQTILVVGGGISGMTAAIEAAECGKQVILLEKNPSLGGRVSQLYKYFPKLCHPTCGMEINLRRIKANKNLRVMTHGRSHGHRRRGRQLHRHRQDPRRATSTTTAPPAANAPRPSMPSSTTNSTTA